MYLIILASITITT